MTRPYIAPDEEAHREVMALCREARTWTALDLIRDEAAEIWTLVSAVFCAGFFVICGVFAIGPSL